MKYINQQGFMIEVDSPYDLYLKYVQEGGGFQKFMSKKEFDENFKPWDGVRSWRLTEVCIDGTHSYPAHLSGRLWNGWEMPMFTKEVGLQLAGRLANIGDPGLQWQPELAAFTYESAGEVETFESEEIQVDGEILTVYGIGAGSWCWDEA